MHITGVFDDMKKITSQYYIFTVRSFILQMQTEDYFMKIEGQKYQTTSLCSQITISEDD